MIWNDIILDIELTNKALSNRLANSFKLNIKQVIVSEAIENVDEFLTVTCIRNNIEGDFNTLLNLYLNFQPDDTVYCLKELSKNLHTDILTSNELTTDPYSMLLVKEDGKIKKVRLISDKLDNTDEYYLEDKSVLLDE